MASQLLAIGEHSSDPVDSLKSCEDHLSTVATTDPTLSGDGEESREQGFVKSFNKSKGYGFIRIQSRTDDVYFQTMDLTPRSKQHVLNAARINTGAPITCAPEAFGDSRVRARSIRLEDGTNVVKTPEAVVKAPVDEVVKVVAVASLEPVAQEKVTTAPVRLVSKPVLAVRPRGWGARSCEEVSGRHAELMAMGFSKEDAENALASGRDFNDILDTLLSSGKLDAISPSGKLDSLPTTRACSDNSNASDHASSCESPEKMIEVTSEGPDDELKLPSASEIADWAQALPCEISAEVSPQVSEPRIRQLARVTGVCPEDNSGSQLSVQRGVLIYTWKGSATDNGWIYGERLNMGDMAGWIPTNVLTMLPPSYEWRRVTQNCKSFSDEHLAGDQGDIILVDAASIEEGSNGGWILGERLDGTKSGLFPTDALEKLSSQIQWMRALSSLDAQHETQASIEKGDLLFVDPESRTKEGWAYAWAVDRHCEDSIKRAGGWVPVNCLEWLQK